MFHKKKLLGSFSGFQSKELFKTKVETIIKDAQKSLNELPEGTTSCKIPRCPDRHPLLPDVEKLIAAGVDINAALPNGLMPIMFALGNAVRGGDQSIAIVKLLLDKGVGLKEIEHRGIKVGTPREVVVNMIKECKTVIERFTILLEMFDATLAKQNCSATSCTVA